LTDHPALAQQANVSHSRVLYPDIELNDRRSVVGASYFRRNYRGALTALIDGSFQAGGFPIEATPLSAAMEPAPL
jgi:hypothetical protein